MSLIETMRGEESTKRGGKVFVHEIRTNEKNFYPIEGVEELALSIKENGQLENATIYEESGEDGKKYTLIGGERRYRAVSLLLERGEGEGILYATIIEKPETEDKEQELIIADNIQRTKDATTKDAEIKIASILYDKKKEQGEIPSGTLKRDFIGKVVGMTGRNVANYISGRIGKNKKPKEIIPPSTKDIDNIINRVYKQIEKARDLANTLDEKEYIDKLVEVMDALEQLKDLKSEE